MATKQLGVNLMVSADTTKAKQQLQNLQKDLSTLSTKSLKGAAMDGGITSEIKKASMAAADLQAKLNAAINVETGKLDLTKFSRSLEQGSMSLRDYRKQFEKLGADGVDAFAGITQAIVNAETPIIKVNKKLSEFWTTLKNTARWQISSSMLNAFSRALSSAFSYAQNLNKSLNEIRIVTGQTADEMTKFAEKANKAARALSTTTNEYARAALIFFQQGAHRNFFRE